MKDATKRAIIRLKEVKAQKGLSCQDIVELCDKNQKQVSPTTVRRFFSKGSEDGPDFRQYTISAIFHAMIGTEEVELSETEEASLSDAEKEVVAENAALKAVIELQERSIEELNATIDELTSRLVDAKAEKEAMQIRIDTLTDVIRLAVGSIGGQSVK